MHSGALCFPAGGLIARASGPGHLSRAQPEEVAGLQGSASRLWRKRHLLPLVLGQEMFGPATLVPASLQAAMPPPHPTGCDGGNAAPL